MGLFDIFTTKNADQAAADQKAGLDAGYSQASGLLDQGRQALSTNYAAGLSPYQQNYATGNAGQNAYANATGVNGAQGYADALKQFQNSPGFQGALQTGSENVLRNHSRTGDVRSGADNVDLQNVGQNLQNQQWQQYLTNLQPFLNTSATAANGIGGLYGNLGTQLNQSYGTQANAAYGTQTGIGNANANAALAGNAASGNFVNSLMGVAGLGANTLGAGAAGAAGSAASGAGSAIASALPSLLMFSDERLKDDIEPVGELFDGTNIYRYRYKGDPSNRTHIGVMAQEVEQDRPEAVVEVGGYKAVDYGKATNFAAELHKFLEAA